MRDKELYTQILGIQAPWEVSDIELDLKAGERQRELQRLYVATAGTE